MSLPRLALLFLCALLTTNFAALPAAHAANGPALGVIGDKGPVNTPVDGDGWSAFRMPSSIGWNLDKRVDLDLFYFVGRSTFQNLQNDYDSVSGTFGGNIGAVFALGRPDFDAEPEAFDNYSYANKWTLHVGEYVELSGGGGTSTIRSTTYPDTIQLGTGITFLTTAFTVAYTPTEWLSLAVQADVIVGSLAVKTLSGGTDSSLNGSPQIAGVPLPGSPTYADFLGLFSSGNASDPTTYFESNLTGLQFTGTFGFSIRPTDNFGIGFSYRPRSAAIVDFEGKAEVDATRTFSEALGGLSTTIQNLFLDTLPNQGNNGFVSDYNVKITGIRVPRQARASVAYWPIPRLMLAGEVAWIEWHRAFKKGKIELTNGTNGDLNFVVGANSVDTLLKLRFENQFVYSLYAAAAATDWLTLRVGFQYGRSPINITTSGNGPSAGFVDASITAGGSVRLGPVELGLLLEYGLPREVKSDGAPESLSAKFTTYRSEQLFIHFGVSFRF